MSVFCPGHISYKRYLLYIAGVLLLILLGSDEGRAQQCTGYALYQENFGTGNSNSNRPLPAGVTTYMFTTATPVEDGYYGIRKQVTGHSGTWFPATDHTGDGYMMLVNASYEAGLFYETKIENLCQGSSFYFSSWVANLMRKGSNGDKDPDLKFVIRRASDSVVIDSLETGLLPRYSTLTWEQYGINFSLPSGESSVILQIFNNADGGNGNDLVLDDITFSLCGPPIQVNQTGTYQNTEDACVGDHIIFSATVAQGFYKNPAYQWQFSPDSVHWQDINGATGLILDLPSVQPKDSGWYRFLVSEEGNIHSAHCRISSRIMPLLVWSHSPIIFTTNSPVCEGDSLTLSVPAGALSYDWKGPDGFESHEPAVAFVKASSAEQGTYSLTRITRGGCVNANSTNLTVQANDLKVALGHDSVFCQGNTVMLDATNAGATYMWNTGDQTPSITVDTGGFYRVMVTKGVCKASDSISIRSVLRPLVDLGNDTSICIGESYLLNVAYPDVDDYLWQDGSAAPEYKITQAGTYSVTLSNQCGVAVDAVHVNTELCADHLIFPTAFSPNGDGQNDYFRPRVFIQVNNYDIRIFDRWGRQVHYGTDPLEGWDGRYKGKTLPLGGYVWIARYKRQRDGQPVSQKGTVTLLR